MATEFKLPDVGEGIHEGEIVKWLVQVGQTVEEDQPLVEVMTDKATVEIPSPVAGTILELKAQEGEVAEVGSVLVVIGAAGEAPQANGRQATSQAQAAARPAQPVEPAIAPSAGPAVSAPSQRTRVLATPATRKLARQLGVEIAQVSGSGPNGRVTDADVKSLAAAGPAPLTRPTEAVVTRPMAANGPAPRPEAREERLPLRGIRKVISDHMIHAVTTAAHFTFVDEVDMTELVKTRTALKPVAEAQGIKLTYLSFIVKAVVGALKRHPYLNASLDHERQEIIVKHYYHIGIATATEQGLIVPVVKNADRLSILAIAAEIQRLSEKVREGKVALEELQGGTFTITSLGAQGGLFATPIINSPESAILGIHEISKRPVVRHDQIVIRQIMFISLSFDHRLIDGHVGAAFAKEVKAFLEDPDWLLIGA
ncbi:MAG TPA: 2-oxo acid dehydrogenase subunit E2 [Candidatus Fraserbacteria bacterium]|nr:2-oxo acid dehydrogenase subunit E2 [Candidatus Fraserbacteria bacterium]